MQKIGRKFETTVADWITDSASTGQPSTGRGDKEQAQTVLHLAFICELYEIQVHGGRYFLHTHSHSADSWGQPTVVDFMNRFPDTFQTVTDRSLFGPKCPSRWEHADEVVDKFRLHRTGTQLIDSLVHGAPHDYERNVPAVTV